MSHLDPQNPSDLHEILMVLIEEKVIELGASEVLDLLTRSQSSIYSLQRIIEIGSVEELNLMLTDFHFSQQIIFDFYEDEKNWEY